MQYGCVSHLKHSRRCKNRYCEHIVYSFRLKNKCHILLHNITSSISQRPNIRGASIDDSIYKHYKHLVQLQSKVQTVKSILIEVLSCKKLVWCLSLYEIKKSCRENQRSLLISFVFVFFFSLQNVAKCSIGFKQKFIIEEYNHHRRHRILFSRLR